MKEGRLGYNSDNKRYGLLISDLWERDGFHCGECMEVMVEGDGFPPESKWTTAASGIW